MEPHNKPRGPGGRPRNPNIEAGTRRARGRTLRDPDPDPVTRLDQLRAVMKRERIEQGDVLDDFASYTGNDWICPPHLRVAMLAADYAAAERTPGAARVVRSLPPFTAAELAEIVAGDGPVNAPWPVTEPAQPA